MIVVDIPTPQNCDDCPFSYMIRTGMYEGRRMCNAMEARGNALRMAEPEVTYNPYSPEDYLVDDYTKARPCVCPIIAEIDTEESEGAT